MNEPVRQGIALTLGAISTMLVSTDVTAQTCANPLHAYANSVVSGTTCGSNSFPEMNHGTISTPGDDLVFKVSGVYGVDSLILENSPDVYVFVCSGCGVNAECVSSAAGVAGGFAIAWYPWDDEDYYVIVDSAYSGCVDYTLSVAGPLSVDP